MFIIEFVFIMKPPTIFEEKKPVYFIKVRSGLIFYLYLSINFDTVQYNIRSTQKTFMNCKNDIGNVSVI